MESHATRIRPSRNRMRGQRWQLENSVESALEASDFLQFSRELNDPHSSVHVFLGCQMSFIQTAAYGDKRNDKMTGYDFQFPFFDS